MQAGHVFERLRIIQDRLILILSSSDDGIRIAREGADEFALMEDAAMRLSAHRALALEALGRLNEIDSGLDAFR